MLHWTLQVQQLDLCLTTSPSWTSGQTTCMRSVMVLTWQGLQLTLSAPCSSPPWYSPFLYRSTELLPVGTWSQPRAFLTLIQDRPEVPEDCNVLYPCPAIPQPGVALSQWQTGRKYKIKMLPLRMVLGLFYTVPQCSPVELSPSCPQQLPAQLCTLHWLPSLPCLTCLTDASRSHFPNKRLALISS